MAAILFRPECVKQTPYSLPMGAKYRVLYVLNIWEKIYSSPLVPHLHVSMNWISIASGNGLLPVWDQAITWTNADLLSIGLLATNLSEV